MNIQPCPARPRCLLRREGFGSGFTLTGTPGRPQVSGTCPRCSPRDTPGTFPGHPRDTPGTFPEIFGTPLDTPGHSQDTPGHSQDTPGHPRDTPGHPRDTPGDSRVAPGPPQDPRRRQEQDGGWARLVEADVPEEAAGSARRAVREPRGTGDSGR